MLALLLALPFVGALMLLVMRETGIGTPRGGALLTNGAALAVLGWLTLQWDPASPTLFTVPWVPALGLEFSVWLDGPALFWAWLVLGIGFGVVHYAGHYMKPDDAPWRFYASLLFFMGSMLGVVTAHGLLLMFVFWEMTSVSSFLLIGHWHHKASARKGARRALLLTGGGGLCLLAGLALLSFVLSEPGGSPFAVMTWDMVWARSAEIVEHPWAIPILILMLIGVFTKSAQFPFHFWLPGAMEAPTPVSAYLHAATMVKAGIYLLGRIYPIFGSLEIWLYVVGGIGLVTMLVGGWLALFCRDIKQLLAYSTVSQLGLLTAYYGLGFARVGTEHLLTLDLLLVASHALFKAGLFMLCGSIDHGTHTRDWMRLGGLWGKMRATAVLTILGCVSMAGLPFSLGFVAKKLLIDAGFDLHAAVGGIGFAFVGVMILGSAFTMAYCVRLAVDPFFGKPRDREVFDHAHESGWGMLAAPAVLIGLCIAAGFYVPLIEIPVARLVQPEFYGLSSHYTVAFFKYIDAGFWATVAIVLGGLGLYKVAVPMERSFERLGRPAPLLDGFDNLFGGVLDYIAKQAADFVHCPSLQKNLALILVVSIGLLAAPLIVFRPGLEFELPGWHIGTVFAAVMGLMLCVMGLAVAMLKGALSRILTLNLVGVLVGGYFILYKAPDLGITQILVELVILLMMLLLLRRFGHYMEATRSRLEGVPTFAIAAGSGALMAVLTFFAASSPMSTEPVMPGNPTHKEFYLHNTKYPMEPGAHSGGGNNAVNVILVDFRALDTLGEMVVVVIAALGIAVLLTAGRKQGDGTPPARRDGPHRPRHRVPTYPDKYLQGGNSVIMRQLSRPIAALALAFSIVLFFAGHNAPGGGFIGGLLCAVALVPFLLAFRKGEPGQPEFKPPLWMLPAGMFIALLTGILPMIPGLEFLRTAYEYYQVPLLGEIELSTALLFDLGIFLAVVGAVLTVLKMFWSEGGREAWR